MNNSNNLRFHIGPFGDNRWIALTSRSPYVCLEAESKEALAKKLKRLADFASKKISDIVLIRARGA